MSATSSVVQAFDGNAEGYDSSLERILAVKHAIHLLIRSQFSGLSESARILFAGAGTGAEARFLAPIFPRWHFTLVDPSGAMLSVARRHAAVEGFADRCAFHHGLVSSVAGHAFDAATSVLVSHFLPDPGERQAYFAEIAQRLKPGARFFNADLCADPADPSYETVMDLWLAMAGTPDERKAAFRGAFGRQIAAHGPAEVEAMILQAGFSAPAPVFQAALVRGWVAVRMS